MPINLILMVFPPANSWCRNNVVVVRVVCRTAIWVGVFSVLFWPNDTARNPGTHTSWWAAQLGFPRTADGFFRFTSAASSHSFRSSCASDGLRWESRKVKSQFRQVVYHWVFRCLCFRAAVFMLNSASIVHRTHTHTHTVQEGMRRDSENSWRSASVKHEFFDPHTNTNHLYIYIYTLSPSLCIK